MRTTVTLSKQKSEKGGKSYSYWVLRWFGADGKRRGQQIGKIGEMSKRQAEKRRQEKENELQANPGRRNVSRSPEFARFLEQYYADRRTELSSGTLELHQLTGRYLVGFFGELRRLDAISRADARAFRTALADGELAHLNKRLRCKNLAVTTVDQHIRQAKKIFNHALDGDLITFNPFDRIGQSAVVAIDWHYVDSDEFGKLMAAAKPAWRLLLALARWAGLRLAEALELPWQKTDLNKGRLTVISRDESAAEGEFKVKDKDSRVVPICPELSGLLREIPRGQAGTVIPLGSVVRKNAWRDFQVLAKKAGVKSYPKPFHSLRKSCITDWADGFAAHVVMEWAGHQDIRTTLKYYLKVSESEYDRAAGWLTSGIAKRSSASGEKSAERQDDADHDAVPSNNQAAESCQKTPEGSVSAFLPFSADVTGKVTGKVDFEPSICHKYRAGEGIRTLDVQLGKLAFYH